MDFNEVKNMSLNTINEAITDLKQGKMIIVVDDENRENEGDFVMPAETVNADAINFMITKGRGLVCVPMQGDYLDKLNLSPMVPENSDPYRTAFTISVDHKSCTTGISAFERANTIRELINQGNTREDFVVPGHVFPLRAKDNGVIKRAGHTEAAVDLAKLAGFQPAGVICEIISENGEMARLPELKRLAKIWNLKIISIEDLIRFRLTNETTIQREVKIKLPTKYGTFDLIAYSASDSTEPHIALVMGDPSKEDVVLTRLHSECFTGDLLGSLKCDCGNQLKISLETISKHKSGILLYLRQEGRGIGLINKLKTYQLQEKGFDTVDANLKLGFEAEMRDYYTASQILKDLDAQHIRLLTNNPDKIEQLSQYGIDVQRTALEIESIPENLNYLRTKKVRMKHMLKCCKL